MKGTPLIKKTKETRERMDTISLTVPIMPMGHKLRFQGFQSRLIYKQNRKA